MMPSRKLWDGCVPKQKLMCDTLLSPAERCSRSTEQLWCTWKYKSLCFPHVKQYPVFTLPSPFSLEHSDKKYPLFLLWLAYFSCSSLYRSLFQNHFFALLKFLRNKHHEQRHTDDLYSSLGTKLIQDFVQELPKISILLIIKEMHGQSYEWRLPRNGLCCAHLSLVLSSLQLLFPNIMKQIKSAFSASISSIIN